MIRRGVVALAVSGVVALAMGGCGSSSPTVARFVAQASRICTRALDQGARIAPPAVPAQTGAFLRRGITTLTGELADLRALQVPHAQAGTYGAAVDSLTQALLILTARVHALDRGADPVPTVKSLQRQLAQVEARGDAAWRTLGVPACVTR
ncbi:MAG: hypothetical protein JO130_05570 [Solirubrobacterales bacterium]|nr:hypothetical protein [Solirubrobacterales bacterium]